MGFLKVVLWIVVIFGCSYWCWKGISFAEGPTTNDRFGNPVRGSRKLTINWTRVISSVVVFFITISIVSSFGTIPAGHRGVVLQFGGVTGRILDEGFYTVKPFVESVEQVSVQVQAVEAKAASASKDLQDVFTTVTINYHQDPQYVALIYQRLGRDYDRIITPAIQEVVKATTAGFDAEKLIVERPMVKERIEHMLRERIGPYHFVQDAVSITDFKFSKKFTEAIEDKVTAQQQALKAGNDLDRIKKEAEQKIETAKAEAAALRAQKAEVTPELIKLRQMEAFKTLADKWDGKSMPHVMVLGGNGAMPMIDITKQ